MIVLHILAISNQLYNQSKVHNTTNFMPEKQLLSRLFSVQCSKIPAHEVFVLTVNPADFTD